MIATMLALAVELPPMTKNQLRVGAFNRGREARGDVLKTLSFQRTVALRAVTYQIVRSHGLRPDLVYDLPMRWTTVSVVAEMEKRTAALLDEPAR